MRRWLPDQEPVPVLPRHSNGLIAWVVTPALPLAFRWEELAAMAGATALVAVVVYDGRSRRWEGWLLISLYVAVAVWFGFAGNR